jgi:beta-lactamase regulating signal transducer with metallopeptidase domain
MKTAEWLNAEMLKVIGWTIIHSIWQFLVLFAALKALLSIISKGHANLRYLAGVIMLSLAVTCTIVTFNHEYKSFINNDTLPASDLNYSARVNAQTKYYANNFVTKAAPSPTDLALNLLNVISPYLTFIWIAGMMLYIVKILAGGIYLSGLRKLSTESFPDVYNKMEALREKIQISKAVRLIINQKIHQPLTFGTFKPAILLPCSYVTQVPVEQLEMILAHELAHIKRYDYLVNLVQASLDAIFFYNPFFRLISEAVRDEREYCCDDMAAASCGDSHTMAMALTNLKILTSYQSLSLSAAPKKSTFRNRVNRLISPENQPRMSVKTFLLIFFITVATITLLTRCVYYQKEYANLPAANDQITQLLTDNQANYKEQLFGYTKSNKDHEIFLVSTIQGKALYAYLDGDKLSENDLQQLVKVLQQKRTVTAADMARMAKDPANLRYERHARIAAETDSLDKIVSSTKLLAAAHPSTELESKLKELNKQVELRNKEEVALSMEEYRETIKNIPADVKLHVLLTRIIVNKEYTPTDAKALNELIGKKTGM